MYPKKSYKRYVVRLGRFVGVLEAGQDGGIACWTLRGVPFCAVGQLSAAIPAAGLRLAQGAGGRAIR